MIRELFGEWFDVATEFFFDLKWFFVAPQEFFRIVNNESRSRTIVRLFMYAFVYDIVVLLLFVIVMPSKFERISSVSVVPVFVVVTVELIVALAPLPAFVVTAYIIRSPVSKRSLLTFVVVYKFLFTIPGVAFYVLFVSTENYVDVYFRGGLLFIWAISFPLLHPFFCYDKTTPRRWLASIVALLLVLIYSFGVVEFVVWQSRGDESSRSLFGRFIEYSYFFDPIAREFMNNMGNNKETALPATEALEKSEKALLQSVTAGSSRDNAMKFAYSIHEIRVYGDTNSKRVEAALKDAIQLQSSLIFRTTKRIQEKRIAALKELLRTTRTASSLENGQPEGFTGRLRSLISETIDFNKAASDYYESLSNYEKVLRNASTWGLDIW